MWVWKDEYNKLRASRDFWEEQYKNLSDRREKKVKELFDCLGEKQGLIDDLIEQIKSLQHAQTELQEYKQKYADEVQKRLELVKLLENTP